MWVISIGYTKSWLTCNQWICHVYKRSFKPLRTIQIVCLTTTVRNIICSSVIAAAWNRVKPERKVQLYWIPLSRPWSAYKVLICFVFLWRCGPTRAMASSSFRSTAHTQRRITVGTTPLDKWSARRRDLYMTTHNTHNRQTSMPLAGFEPTIPASERPQTHFLDRAVAGIGRSGDTRGIILNKIIFKIERIIIRSNFIM